VRPGGTIPRPMRDFAATISEAYATKGAAIDLGRGVHGGELATDAVVRVPLRMMNRHGLVAGATGAGMTGGVFGMLKRRL
jgi:uncharacterized protein